MPKEISIVIPAFNEEKNIVAAIDSVVSALSGIVDSYEILVINDGSKDRTGLLAEEKAKQNPQIRVLHNEVNGGYGFSLVRGIKAAKKFYISVFPGDNDMDGSSFRDIVKETGNADLIISYMGDMKNRSFLRRVLSRTFILMMNAVFGLRLRYFNGAFVCKREIIQSLSIKGTGLAVVAECVVRMIKAGCSYKEVRFEHTGRKAGKSTALTMKSIKSVARTVGILIYDIHLARFFRRNSPCAISSSL